MMKASKVLMAGVYFVFVVCSVAWGQDRLTVDTKINGQDAVFAFDTGTSVSLVVFEQTVERFSLNTSEQKGLKIARFEFEIGTSKLKAEAVLIDSPPVQVDGLIGWPFLKGKIWAVLWGAGTLARIRSVPEQAQSWLQIGLATDVPVLAFAEGERGRGLIFIDTGDSGGVSLSGARWKQWLKEHPDAPMTLSSGWSPALGGIYVGRQCWSDRLDLGPFFIPGARVSRAGHKWPRLEAVIGLEALSRFEVILDLKESLIYLKGREGDPLEPEYNRLGATFVPESMDSAELKAQVLIDSPGYRCGIRNGDILLKVDDVDMTKWREDPSIWKRRFWYAEPGTQYNLELERGGKRIYLQVRLEEIFPVGRNKEKDNKDIQEIW
jgi:hypothetical protein